MIMNEATSRELARRREARRRARERRGEPFTVTLFDSDTVYGNTRKPHQQAVAQRLAHWRLLGWTVTKVTNISAEQRDPRTGIALSRTVSGFEGARAVLEHHRASFEHHQVEILTQIINLIEDGAKGLIAAAGYEDHSPATHEPKGWMPIPPQKSAGGGTAMTPVTDEMVDSALDAADYCRNQNTRQWMRAAIQAALAAAPDAANALVARGEAG